MNNNKEIISECISMFKMSGAGIALNAMQVYRGLALLPKTSFLVLKFWRPDLSLYLKSSHIIWREDQQILEGHTGSVLYVVFSSDGTKLASASEDNTVCLWNVATGTPIGSALEGHTQRVSHVVFSPDGTKLASASRDNTVHLWNVATGTAIGSALEQHTTLISHVIFSPESTQLTSVSSNDIVCLWDVGTQSLIQVYTSNLFQKTQCSSNLFISKAQHFISDTTSVPTSTGFLLIPQLRFSFWLPLNLRGTCTIGNDGTIVVIGPRGALTFIRSHSPF